AHLHQRVPQHFRRAREPGADRRAHHPARLPSRKVPERGARQGVRGERAPVVPHRDAAGRRVRLRADRRPDRAAHRVHGRRGRRRARRRAGRPDPLRQPLRRLPARRLPAAGRRRPARDRRRDGVRRRPAQSATPRLETQLMLPRRAEGRRRQRKRLRAQPLIHLVPNMFTVLALCAGLTSIRYALDGAFELAVALIVVAGVLDGLDGRSARLLKISSKLGAQLDSLADFLSFGVAPAILVYLWSLDQVPAFGWALALLYATCCALRLARFNTELEDTDRPVWMSRFFTGMPAPAAAGCAIMPMMATFAFQVEWPRAWPLNAVVLIVISYLMVSRIPTFSIKT